MAVILNPDQNNDQNAQTGPTTGAPLQTIGTAAPAGQNASAAPGAANKPQGSGRFTNLQKYLQANQGAGQRIAGQVGKGFEQQYGQQSKQAKDYYDKLGQSVQQAQGVAQAGKGYQQQLQDIGSQIGQAQQAGYGQREQQAQNLGGIEAFTQQPGFNQFQDIQAGRGINENLLGLQQQRAAQAAGQTLQGVQQAQQALGTEAGRYELLRKSLGGMGNTGYTQGQQRLDQVLLGQGGGLGGLQTQTAQQLQAAQQQAKLAQAQGGTVQGLAEAEKGLVSGINTQAGKNEQAYMNMLQSYMDPLNQQRTQEFENLNKAVGAYAGTPEAAAQWKAGETTGFTPEQMARLGLTDTNQGVYNVFRGPGGVTTGKDIAEQGRQAMNAQDVANQSDVNRYQALSKIMGTNAPQAITQASDIGEAYTAKTGEAGLKERLAAAQSSYDTLAKQRLNVTGHGMGAGDTVYATPEDLVNQGIASARGYDASSRQTFDPNKVPYANFNSFYKNLRDQLSNQFGQFTQQQNYNQTLGGQRQTYLDTLKKLTQTTPTGGTVSTGMTTDFTPITQTDPSLNYGKKGS